VPDVVPSVAAWTEVAAPSDLGLAGLEISSAVAVARDDLLFAASFPEDAPNKPAQAEVKVVRWTRGVWTVELTAIGPAGWRSRVSATAPDDAWAVLGTTLYHRNANGWQPFDESWRALLPPPASPSEAPIPAGPMRAGGRDEVWVMASGTMLHWASGAWQALSIPVAEPQFYSYAYSEIWVGGPDDVWLGGAMEHVTGGPIINPALLLRFDGASFTEVPFGLWTVYGLWGDGAGGVWVAAARPGQAPLYHGALLESDRGYVAIDGWSEQAGVASLWGRAADDVWAAGDDIAHWDGTKWSRNADASDSTRAPINGGVTVVTGDAASVWLVTAGPRFFRFGTPTP
jgi:hypothetical protein